ncbi:5'-nucleotidase C-terminal domain-containing protein [Galbibacter mesophilus]|uniref:5'-nucleotidase C-terminal domain-containing protein n=1 Tax=Galbibacter mesophilus TaxID=379069 RepID=UPI00191F0B40|nr:5'-nucleotidase [Galbibacter mesophilus]MCM5662769.1 5'-nucleotidase C-terminal domain-containing protein [Galbibacter mesophilus]
MRIKTTHFVTFITMLVFLSCKENSTKVYKISGKEIKITDSLQGIDSLKNFITPYRTHIEEVLDEPLAFSTTSLSKDQGELNTAIGNLMADITYEQSNPVFHKRTGKNIDFVLLNHGGIRASLPKGNISRRTAYQLMPFENKILVLELSSEKIEELIEYLVTNQRAHPICKQIQIVLNKDNSLNSVTINGESIDKEQTYFVATSDYLASGGDKMDFFKNPISSTDLDYLLRNELIDYFQKVDTIRASIDNRFYKQ